VASDLPHAIGGDGSARWPKPSRALRSDDATLQSKEIDMSKLTALFAAGALAAGSSVFAAEQNQNRAQDPSQPKDQTIDPAEQTKQDQDYLAAIKKCDQQSGAEKQKCIDKVQEKYNRM
jgi:hypothetical protein